MFSLTCLDLESIVLDIADIADEAVHLREEDLKSAKLEDLKKWLLFRGDSMKKTQTTTECRFK